MTGIRRGDTVARGHHAQARWHSLENVVTDVWVFGYGSLIWDPGFPVEERVLATLHGYNRSFCMSSIHHRGTVEDPGLVLALDPTDGAICEGLALRVRRGTEDETLRTLRERELVSSAYNEAVCGVKSKDGRELPAITYIVNTDHEQYVGGMSLEEQARIIATAQGGRGPNSEYLWNTSEHLIELGIDDPDLSWLSRRVRALTA